MYLQYETVYIAIYQTVSTSVYETVSAFIPPLMSCNPAEPLVQKALGVLEDIVVGISSEGSKSKNVMFSSMKKFVELSVALFPHYLTNPGLCCCSVLLT